MISGQPHLRGELACTRGTWDDTPEQRYAVSYQWYRGGAPINGATNPTYVVGTADLGRCVSCSATAEVLSESFATARHRRHARRDRAAAASRASPTRGVS